MPRLARGEGAALLDRFRRYLRDHHQPITRQRNLVAQVVLLIDPQSKFFSPRPAPDNQERFGVMPAPAQAPEIETQP